MVFIDISPLKNIEFRRLYLSQFISLFGTQMTMVTVPFQVYKLTESTFQTGLISLVELICLFATVFWGGAIADRLDRRKVLIYSEWLMAIFVSFLAVNACLDKPILSLIYGLAGLLSALSGLHRPSFEALTPLVVPKESLAKANALTSFRITSAALLGPAVAGFLVSSIGPFLTYGLDVVSFVVSTVLLMRMTTSFQVRVEEEKVTKSVIKQVIDGAQFLSKRKDILGSYVVDFCAMVFSMPQVLFPALAKFYQQDTWLGAFYVAVGLGSFVASLFSGWTPRIKRLGIGISFAAFGWSLSILTAGVVHSFWLVPFCLFCAGACDGYSGIFRMTMWDESIPANFRGRLASFGMISYMSGPLLGNAIMGFVAEIIGIHQAFAVGGTISVVAVVTTSFFLPEYWAYNSDNYSLKMNQ